MGPFRRGKRQLPPAPPSIDLKIQDASYRRLGDAMATVVVTLDEQPPENARLLIRTESSATTVDPMMVTREMPGTKAETHRMWFAVELSAVMFGDGDFALKTAEGEAALPHPVAQPAWGVSEPEEAGAPIPALAEASLRAALAQLEERLRDAEREKAELAADGRRMGRTVAATLAEVQREREQLLALVEGRDPTPEGDPPMDLDQRTLETSEPAAPRSDAFLKRLNAARGAASADD
jgi:hypothetical protein